MTNTELVQGGNVIAPGTPKRRSVFHTPVHAIITVATYATIVLMGLIIVVAQVHTRTAVFNYTYIALMSSIGLMFWFIHKRTVMPIFTLCIVNVIMLLSVISLSLTL